MLPNGFVFKTGARKLAHRLAHLVAKHFMGHFAARAAHHGEALGQTALQGEIIKRGNQLSFGEISGGAEDRQDTCRGQFSLRQSARRIGTSINGHQRILLLYLVLLSIVVDPVKLTRCKPALVDGASASARRHQLSTATVSRAIISSSSVGTTMAIRSPSRVMQPLLRAPWIALRCGSSSKPRRPSC